VHNLFAAIVATPQTEAAPKGGVTASDAGSFRDVLCSKVVDQSQARAMASKTNPAVVSRVQSDTKERDKAENHNASTAKLCDPRNLDTGDSLTAATFVSVTMLPAPSITPSTAEVSAAPEGGGQVRQTGAALSHIVRVVTRDTSAGAAIGTQLTIAAIAHPDSTAQSNVQVANQSQSQLQSPSEAATEEDIPSSPDDQVLPISSPQTAAPEPTLFSFPGGAASGDAPSLPDGLAHPPGTQQKTDEPDLAPLPSSTTPTDRRDLPMQDQPAINSDVSSGNAPAALPTAPPASEPASQGVAAAATAASQSLNANRRISAGETTRADKKEDHNPARASQPATDAQPESQTMSVRAGGPTMGTEGVSQTATVIGQSPNPDRAQAANMAGGLVGLQTSHTSPEGPLAPDSKAQSTLPTSTSNATDTAATTPPVLQSARVLERMGQSEIRVGLSTANFGNLELLTSVNQNRVAATLATSHSELRAALAAEMPSLEHGMAQHQLTLDSFHLDTRSGAQDKHQGASGDQQDRSHSGTEAAESGVAGNSVAAPETVSPQIWAGPYSFGLSVHA
jgi:flagellar hook-length control protein FliK